MKKNVVIFISLDLYIRNWLGTGAFKEIVKYHNVTYIVPEYDWDPKILENYGINDYIVIKQPEWRKKFFRKFLLYTMYKFSKNSKAFKHKIGLTNNPISPYFYKTMIPFYSIIKFAVKHFIPTWKQLDRILNEKEIEIGIAPSIGADSFTIDFNLSLLRKRKKSVIIINSWDNLVSKGVIPFSPDRICLWGEYSALQATKVQKLNRKTIRLTGVPRFESYRSPDNQSDNKLIWEKNNIPFDKKIILYATTSLPFNDHTVLKELDDLISKNDSFRDYVILYRPHPEMLIRKNEVDITKLGLDNIYFDKELESYYKERFVNPDTPSYLNKTDLSYYPILLNSIEFLICPATTLSLEALMVGKQVLMICFNDGVNFYLSPDIMCQYENVEQVLSNPFIHPVYEKKDLVQLTSKFLSNYHEISSDQIRASTKPIVFTNNQTYSQRLLNVVNELC